VLDITTDCVTLLNKSEQVLAMARKLSTRSVAAGKSEQIATVLEAEIRSGRLGYGDRLESENTLVRRFSVSRNTVRRGLEELSSRGLITTRIGVGSFVTFNGQTINDAIGWSRALADAGAKAETRLLRLERIDDAALAAELNLADPAFIAVDRLRSLSSDGRAISVERSRLPCVPAYADLPERGLVGGSLSETMRVAGRVPHHGEEWADLHRMNAEDAAWFGVGEGTACLRTRRLVRAADGQVIEYVVSLLDPEHFALHLEF
jgi:GntR family transcriptional regulator